MPSALAVRLMTTSRGVFARVSSEDGEQMITANDDGAALGIVERRYGDRHAIVSWAESDRVLMCTVSSARRILSGCSALCRQQTEPR
jgi:hypothetical protein